MRNSGNTTNTPAFLIPPRETLTKSGLALVALRTVGLTLVLMTPGLTGCAGLWGGGGGELRLWAVPGDVTVFPDASPEPENEVFSETARAVRLGSAVNETVSFQLVLSSSREPVSIRGITLGELRQGENVIPAEVARLYREVRVAVTEYPAWYLRLTPFLGRPREFPDLLVPLSAPQGALPIELEPGRCEAIWIDVRVPAGTEPGGYRGVITVAPQSGARQELELVLEVWPFALPQTRHLPVLAGIESAALLRHHIELAGRPYTPIRLTFEDPNYERATAVLDEAMRLLHDHRCAPVLRDVRPVRRIGPGGQLELGWSDYDRLVAGVLEGSTFEDRSAAAAWPMPIDDRDPSPEAYGGWDSSSYGDFVADYLRQCVVHFAERGWLDRHFVWIPPPGHTLGDRYRAFERLGRLVASVDPRLNLVCPLTPQSMAPYGWRDAPFVDVSDFVGVWCPPGERWDARELARQRSAGKRAWLWPGRPPYTGSLSLIAPPVHARSMAWQAYRSGGDAIWLPVVNDWPDDGAARAVGSETALIWPGKAYGLGGPIPSIRLKRLLRGVQDYEYLWLLEHNQRPGIAQRMASDLFARGGTDCYGEHFLDGRAGGWVSEAWAWSLARRLMARELVAAMQAAGDGKDAGAREDIERFEQQIEWARLTEAVRRIQGHVEGVRVRLDRADGSAPLIVEADVSVFNATRRPFSGTLALTDLPEDWSADPSPAGIAGLEPGKSTRRVVRARAKTVQPNAEGVLPVRVNRVDDQAASEPLTIAGRLCALPCQRLTHPIVVDGRLDDWPLATEVASDFLLVGAGDVPKQYRPDPVKASQLTTVFVCEDGVYLYIAFNCREENLAGRCITRSNFVRYDDLWPVGEDLVEVVLDPTGKALGPGDLLHIVVKANGAVITERGVLCLDRVAPYAAWPAGVVAAVDDQSQPDCWTVEIRIPLASLGQRASIWGVNFARFDAQRGEYASWSAARSHLYNPVTLGNLRLP